MEIGSQWKDWTVDSLIGEGSSGKVYKIVRQGPGYSYDSALKVIHIPKTRRELMTLMMNEGMTEADATTYYESLVDDIVREFSFMSRLRGSSYIVSFEDHSVEKDPDEISWTIYIRMELVTPLFSWLQENRMLLSDVRKMGVDLLKALEQCQKYQIIHRDIKPENIFCSRQGTFKLGDFGIARQMEKTVTATSNKGTYSYMAPEVYKGLSYNATVDVYSLGLVLYRFLNNNRGPFMPQYPDEVRYMDRENANLKRMTGQEIPLPCHTKGELGRIILKACAYRPEDRYDSPQEMRRELEAIAIPEDEDRILFPLSKQKAVEDGEKMIPSTSVAQELTEDGKEGSAKKMTGGEGKAISPAPAAKKMTTDGDGSSAPEGGREKQESVHEKSEGGREKQEPVHEKPEGGRENRQPGKRPVRKGLAVAFILICAGIIIAAADGYFFTHYTRMPDVVGKSVKTAEAILEESNAAVIEKTAFSDEVGREHIISQEPGQGAWFKKGSEVSLTVSKGKAVTVPKLTGLKRADAKEKAESKELGFSVEKKAWSDDVKKGYVISQTPAAGSDCEEGAEITVVISKGVEQVKVPDVVEMEKAAAKKALKEKKLSATFQTEYSSTVSEGCVIRQSVKAGETVKKNTKVKLTISLGPESGKSTNSSTSNGSASEKTSSEDNSSDSISDSASSDSSSSGNTASGSGSSGKSSTGKSSGSGSSGKSAGGSSSSDGSSSGDGSSDGGSSDGSSSGGSSSDGGSSDGSSSGGGSSDGSSSGGSSSDGGSSDGSSSGGGSSDGSSSGGSSSDGSSSGSGSSDGGSSGGGSSDGSSSGGSSDSGAVAGDGTN